MSHDIECVDQEGGASRWNIIVQPMHSHRDILHIDCNDSPTVILHPDGHGIAVQEIGDIVGSVQKLTKGGPRAGRRACTALQRHRRNGPFVVGGCR
jgi:hypothetical protein